MAKRVFTSKFKSPFDNFITIAEKEGYKRYVERIMKEYGIKLKKQ